MPEHFPGLSPLIPDPVFALMRQAKEAGPRAINATVGMILNEEGVPELFGSVRQACTDWQQSLSPWSLAYPPLLGIDAFRSIVKKMIFGDGAENIATLATTGGTGALAINLQLVRHLDKKTTVIIPTPTWSNHAHLCTSAGLQVVTVPYLAHDKPSIDGILEALQSATGSTAVLLHAACHNPTGRDFTEHQWTTLAKAMKQKQSIAVMDMAYQGFQATEDEDTLAIRILRKHEVPQLIAWSAAKNHSMYGLRVGAACATAGTAEETKLLEGQYASLTRGIHSASAVAGQEIVVLTQEKYRDQWLDDLQRTRDSLDRKRAALQSLLTGDLHKALEGKGLYALLPLSREQVKNLRDDHKIFLTNEGRINLGGIPESRVEECARAINNVTA